MRVELQGEVVGGPVDLGQREPGPGIVGMGGGRFIAEPDDQLDVDTATAAHSPAARNDRSYPRRAVLIPTTTDPGRRSGSLGASPSW